MSNYDRRKTAADLTYPTVHLNGTGKEGLLTQAREMGDAVRKAIKSLEANGPHGRDYYVQQDPNAFTKARQEHVDRLKRLQSVYDELADLAMNISRQGR